MKYKFNLKGVTLTKIFGFINGELGYFQECIALKDHIKGIIITVLLFFTLEFVYLINNVAMSATGDWFNINALFKYLGEFWDKIFLISLFLMVIILVSLMMIIAIMKFIRCRKYVKVFEKFIGDNEINIDNEKIEITNGKNKFYFSTNEIYYILKKDKTCYYLDNRKELLFCVDDVDNDEIYKKISEVCKNLIKD